MMIEKKGFDGIYILGLVLLNDLGYLDIGFITLIEVVSCGCQVVCIIFLSVIIDVDIGWGELMNVIRIIQEFIEMGLAGCHLEDQMNLKCCGYLDNKLVVVFDEMVCKIVVVVCGKKLDENFLIIVCIDLCVSEGLDKVIDCAKAYVDVGAEMIFLEVMQDEKEFEVMCKVISVLLLVNMIEFGKGKFYIKKEFENLGYNMVIYFVMILCLVMGVIEKGLDIIKLIGLQIEVILMMQICQQLYDLMVYEEYNQFDQNIFNFKLK